MQQTDLDAFLLFHLCNGGKEAVQEVNTKGVTGEMLSSFKHRQAFDLCVDQAANDGTTPEPADLKMLFGNVVKPSSIQLVWVITHLHRRREFNEMAVTNEKVQSLLQENDPVTAKEEFLASAERLKNDPSEAIKPTSIFDLGSAVKAEYETNESGELGIPTPWDAFNAMTRGLYPGTNTWFLARPGTGKTWILLVLALFAWLEGQKRKAEGGKPIRILIISPEMLKVQMAERFFTMLAKVAYGQVVGGTLGHFGKQSFFECIDANMDKEGIFILDAADGINPQRIELAIEQSGADVVVIDSAYKVKWKERAKDRFENMFTGVDLISTWSKREWSDGRKIAVLAASQLNRAADKKGGKDKSAVALSDNLSWEADNMFFLEQDEDMKADKRLRLLTEKVRRMAHYVKSILLNWNMETMDFTQVQDHAHNKTKFEDDEFNEDDF